MIERYAKDLIEAALNRQAAVALIGPRQVGKTTIAMEFAKTRPSVYMDLESPIDREKLSDPIFFLKHHEDKLIILDEIHRMPEIFQSLRGIIDEGRRKGNKTGRFLILGSAAIDLLRQSSESLAGRIEYVDLNCLSISELPHSTDLSSFWLRGGFPDSYLATSDGDSLRMRHNFIRTYLERDVPMFGPRIPSQTLERLWTMLAHSQGNLLNASRLAASLSISAPTVTSYIDLLTDLLLVRRLPPYYANVKKRLVKSPKTYIRDSGLLHALLNLETMDEVLAHPVAGGSWEGFVIENLLSVAPARSRPSFYRTLRGAEVDLVLELGGVHGTWAIEIKHGLIPQAQKGFYIALEDIQPSRSLIVYSGSERYQKSQDIEVISLRELTEELKRISPKAS